MVQQGSQLSEWTSFEDPCNALAMLWPQGLQLSEGTEGLRTPAMFGQWSQGSQLSEWTEGLRTPAALWRWSQGSQLSEWTEAVSYTHLTLPTS